MCGNSDQEGQLSCPSWCPPPPSTLFVLPILEEKVHIPKMPWKYSCPVAVKLLPILTLHWDYVTIREKAIIKSHFISKLRGVS